MNLKTKRLTEGAMYLAIIGAMMLINQMYSTLFDVYIPVVASVIVILYTCKYTIRDGIVLSICALVITFLFGTLYTYIYNFIAIITGLIYGHLAKIGTDKRLLMGSAIILFIIGEFIATIMIFPILGLDSLEVSFEMIRDIGRFYNLALPDNLVGIMYIFGVVFLGTLEGILIHLLAVICLKKFKIKVIKTLSLDTLKLKPIYAYILLVVVALMMGIDRSNLGNDITYGIYCFGIIAAIILIAQGYVFALLYGSIGRQNSNFMLALIVIFLIPFSLFVLIIIGFLYATGPLECYLQNRRSNE